MREPTDLTDLGVDPDVMEQARREVDDLVASFGVPTDLEPPKRHPAHSAGVSVATGAGWVLGVLGVMLCLAVVIVGLGWAWWRILDQMMNPDMWEPSPATEEQYEQNRADNADRWADMNRLIEQESRCAPAPTFELGNGRTVAAGPPHCTVGGSYFTLPMYR